MVDQAMLAALNSLSIQQRAIAYFTYWEDLSVDQIAVLLEVSSGAVKKQLARARALAVTGAPEPHEWSDVERRSPITVEHGPRSRRPLVLAVAAALLLGVGGAVVVLTRPASQTIRTDDPVVSEPTSTMSTTATVEQDVVDVDDESLGEALPMLPSSVTEVWSTTIEGSYPPLAVRSEDTIIFGQLDLPGVRAVDAGRVRCCGPSSSKTI